MKTSLLILVLFSSLVSVAQASTAQKEDTAVTRVVEANLRVINQYLIKKESSLQKISDAIIFFTELTGIPSESDGAYYGQYHPTENDAKAWGTWCRFNQPYLFWDKELKSIILYKTTKPVIQ
jgi:hypothetical protein